ELWLEVESEPARRAEIGGRPESALALQRRSLRRIGQEEDRLIVLHPFAVELDRAAVIGEHLAGEEGWATMRLFLVRPGEGERDLTYPGQQRVVGVVHAGMGHP